MKQQLSGIELRGKRVTLLGLGKHGGGVGVARYLAEQGALVTVTDAKPEAELTESVQQLAGLPVRLVLGHHDERDFTPAGADFVVRNPAVPRRAMLLQHARATGVPVEMEMTLFLKQTPARVIGITGTKGKTTTSTLLAAMLQAWNPDAKLAGNMGISALALLPVLHADQPVVLELSSWQLEGMDEHRLSPDIAVLTNISPDHLNTYDSFDDYAETKRRIGAHQTKDGLFVINADDPEVRRVAKTAPGRVIPVGETVNGATGMTIRGRTLAWHVDGQHLDFSVPETSFALSGSHQIRNVAVAASAALLAGTPAAAIRAAIADFRGIPDRNEPVATINGVLFVNDTTATAPAAAVAALERFRDRRIHLISGGANKALDLQALADAISDLAESVTLIDGSATPRLRELLHGAPVALRGPVTSMDDALTLAMATAQAGDVVLLAPGVASFGVFRDEFDRGEQFRICVRKFANEAASS